MEQLRRRSTAVLAAATLTAAGCRWIAPQEEFELPAGFRGWVEVEVENPSCPPLQRRAGVLVISIEKDGTACTSDRMPEGWIRSRFVVRDANRTELQLDVQDKGQGQVRLLSGVGIGGAAGSRTCRFMGFFVGPHSEINQHPRPNICQTPRSTR